MFKYFRGPLSEMSDLEQGDRTCSLCGQSVRCLSLEFCECDELTDNAKSSAFGCFDCLHKGRYSISHDTEVGYVDKERIDQKRWLKNPLCAAIPESAMRELLRTPQFNTWQDGEWLVHCDDFMAYLGEWKANDFYINAKDGDGHALYLAMTDTASGTIWNESLTPEDMPAQDWYATYYAFQCLHCGGLRGYFDFP